MAKKFLWLSRGFDMLRVLIWNYSNDTVFKDKALKILEQQHNGIELVGSSTGEEINKVDRGGHMIFS